MLVSITYSFCSLNWNKYLYTEMEIKYLKMKIRFIKIKFTKQTTLYSLFLLFKLPFILLNYAERLEK